MQTILEDLYQGKHLDLQRTKGTLIYLMWESKLSH